MGLTPLAALTALTVALATPTSTPTPSVPPGAVMVTAPQPQSTDVPPTAAWIAEAVADVLPRRLARLGLRVVERHERLRAMAALELPPGPLSLASTIRVAEAAGATRVVVGEFASQGSLVNLSLRLIDTERGAIGAPFVASGARQELLGLVDTLAWDIAETAGTTNAQERAAFLATRPQIPLAALEAYARGLGASDGRTRMGALRSALKLFPEYAEARLALARVQLERAAYAEANATLASLPSASPLGRAARFDRGRALLYLGRPREAEALYAGLEGEAPTSGVVNNRAVALLRLGQGPAAARLLRQAVEAGNAPADVAFNLGWVLFVGQEHEAAAFWLRGLVAQEARDVRARLVLSWALRRLGRTDEAELEWNVARTQDPGLADQREPATQGRLERILADERPLPIEHEARSDVEIAAAHSGRGERLAEAGELEGALRELTRAAYLDPYGPRLHRSLARVHRRRGEPEKALQELRMSLWCHDDVTVRRELALLLGELGRLDEACREARLVLAATPNDTEARALCPSGGR